MINLKKVLRVLVTGSFTMLLSACYGVMMPFSAVLKVKDSTGDSIPDLEIKYKDYPENTTWLDAGVTNHNGEFQFSTMNYSGEEYMFKIEDVDGDKNGSFKTKEVDLEDNLDNIIMTNK